VRVGLWSNPVRGGGACALCLRGQDTPNRRAKAAWEPEIKEYILRLCPFRYILMPGCPFVGASAFLARRAGAARFGEGRGGVAWSRRWDGAVSLAIDQGMRSLSGCMPRLRAWLIALTTSRPSWIAQSNASAERPHGEPVAVEIGYKCPIKE